MNQSTANMRDPIKIVLLDDMESPRAGLRMVIDSWLKEVHTVIEFDNGDAAWQELSKSDPDMLITDYSHPGMNCGEMLTRLKARGVRYPIVVCSASASEDRPDLLAQLRECAGPELKLSFLEKPFTLPQVCAILTSHLACERMTPPERSSRSTDECGRGLTTGQSSQSRVPRQEDIQCDLEVAPDLTHKCDLATRFTYQMKSELKPRKLQELADAYLVLGV